MVLFPFRFPSAMPGFVPDPALIAAFALAAVVLTLTPGPDMALFVSRAIHHGRTHGLAALSGALTGLVVHSLLAALGISVLIAAAPAAFTALKIGGALYLLFLAVSAARGGGGPGIAGPGRRPKGVGSSYLAGLGINLLNPKIVLFFVTFLPQFVSPSDPEAAGKLFFLGIEFIVVALPFALAMVFAADWMAGTLMRSARLRRLLDWGFASVFASFAAAILFTEIRR